MEETNSPIQQEPGNTESNPQDCQNEKKNKSKILTIILLAVAAIVASTITPIITSQIAGLVFLGIASYSQKDNPKIEDFQVYLENKYGKQKEFYYTGKFDNCNWFETGKCSYTFSSNELDKASFIVTGQRISDDGYKDTKFIFTDNYEDKKNLEKLKLEYYSLLDNAIPYNYHLELNRINSDKTPTLHAYVNFNDIPDIESIDQDALKTKILAAIPEQYQNIEIEFEIVIYDGDNTYGFLEECPDGFSGSYGSNGANSCSFYIK